DLSATDNCDANITVTYLEERANGNCDSSYTLTRTWTATDDCGNTASEVQVITVQDTTAPVLDPAPADITVECDAVPTASATDLSATDNCDANITVTYLEERANGNCDSNYTLTRTWTATDDCGNTASEVQVITVQDTTAPVLDPAPADITVECDAVPTASATDLSATDNCDANITVTYLEERANGNCDSNYTLTRTWTAIDDCGNTASEVQVITVQDSTNPIIDIEASDISIECDGTGNNGTIQDWLDNNGYATVTDNCSEITWTNNYGGASSDCANPIAVTFTATDDCGNFVTTTAFYSIIDTINPTIEIEASDLTVECDGLGNLIQLQTWLDNNGGATASDDCSAIVWDHDYKGVLIPGCGLTGSAIVNFKATDACGNESFTSATFTIIDTIAPVAPTAPDAITVECLTELPEAIDLTATDNCAGDIVASPVDSIDDSNPCNVIVTRTWTFTDSCNNTSSVSQTITVADTIAPVVPA
ncbi:HYR-like domain-containing protein, partial [Bizionia algoritergicola]